MKVKYCDHVQKKISLKLRHLVFYAQKSVNKRFLRYVFVTMYIRIYVYTYIRIYDVRKILLPRFRKNAWSDRAIILTQVSSSWDLVQKGFWSQSVKPFGQGGHGQVPSKLQIFVWRIPQIQLVFCIFLG